MIVADALTWWVSGGLLLASVAGVRRLAGSYRDAVRLAGTDDLTGLGERRAFRQELGVAVEVARTRGEQLSLVLLDVPAVAALHRTHGLRFADSVLADTAWVLASAGGGSRAFRLGGSTFALLLPGWSAPDADLLAADLRRHVGELAGAGGTVSAVCSLDERCPDAETLMIGADAALTDALWHTLAEALDAPVAVQSLVAADSPVEPEPPYDPWDIRRLTG
jgi:diguanylate cyclase (GGDEF)-like protein